MQLPLLLVVKIAEEQVKRQQRVIKKRFSEPLSDDATVTENTI